MYDLIICPCRCVIPPDQIALPDLNPAAMENWGLVTYQEGGLLYEEGVSSLLHKEMIASLIAHELAHQVRERKRKLFCVLPLIKIIWINLFSDQST